MAENIGGQRGMVSVLNCRGPGGAREGDYLEPRTGQDGKTRSTPILKTSGRPSLWQMAPGPAW